MDLKTLDTSPVGEAAARELRRLAERKGADLPLLLWQARHAAGLELALCKAWKAAQVRAWLEDMPDSEYQGG